MKRSCRMVSDGMVHLAVGLSDASWLEAEPVGWGSPAWRTVCGQHVATPLASMTAYLHWPRGKLTPAPATCLECIVYEEVYDAAIRRRVEINRTMAEESKEPRKRGP